LLLYGICAEYNGLLATGDHYTDIKVYVTPIMAYKTPLTLLSDLESLDIVALQYVNKRLLRLARDDTLWREQCFRDSSFLHNLRRRRELLNNKNDQEQHVRDLACALASGNGTTASRLLSGGIEEGADLKARAHERIRIMANWDPSYPREKVSWYDEYIARHAPIQTNWLQQPKNLDPLGGGYLEVRGFALYTPTGTNTSEMVVGPLDDGSVCLWDIGRRSPRRGRLVARSARGLLSVDEHSQGDTNKRSKMLNTAVTECVSVDNNLKRAYFAVQSGIYRQESTLLRGTLTDYRTYRS